MTLHYASAISLLSLALVLPSVTGQAPSERTPKGELVPYAADPSQPRDVAITGRVKSFYGEVFRPTSGQPGTWPGIVLICPRLNEALLHDAAHLATNGYQVLAIDLTGGVSLTETNSTTADDAQPLSPQRMLASAQSAMGFLQAWSMDPELVGAVGYGEGGTLAIRLAAAEPHLKAAVDFGGLQPLDPDAFKAISKRVLMQSQMVPNFNSAIVFLDARLKHPRH
ncbi:MAG: dienelactone hydrolase family protein [Acidobacteriota bacterium]